MRFFAYPAEPSTIGESIEAATRNVNRQSSFYNIKTWRDIFKPGEYIDVNILAAIDASKIVYLDITVPNFNVFFEAGYAIGRGKPVVAFICSSLTGAGSYLRNVGLFETVGLAYYEDSSSLQRLIWDTSNPRPLFEGYIETDAGQPVYMVRPKPSFEKLTRLIGRLRDTGVKFRSFDPNEESRMSIREAVNQVSQSTGVVSVYIGADIIDHAEHNVRAAFVCGLARAMSIQSLLLNFSKDPTPLDVRDFVPMVPPDGALEQVVTKFALAAVTKLQSSMTPLSSPASSSLARINLGNSAAENEGSRLGTYFVETPAFNEAIVGHARVVAGRKGAGKTALFSYLRQTLDQGRSTLVLSLAPDGYQLKKFKDVLVKGFADGTKEHTVTAFWDYVLLLELCHACLKRDAIYVGRDPVITKLLPILESKYSTDELIQEGDFSERTLMLLESITLRLNQMLGSIERSTLTRQEITNIIYKHDVNVLRRDVFEYLSTKQTVVILIDNLDKGWETAGVSSEDILMIRTLMEAGRKVERELTRKNISGFCLIFLRNDVLEKLIDETPDRGKEGKISVDWSNRALFRSLIQKRLAASSVERQLRWQDIAVATVNGQDSFEWVIERSLMRPRYVIDLVNKCLSAATSRGIPIIDEPSFNEAWRSFSFDAVINTDLEIRDTHPKLVSSIYALEKLPSRITKTEIAVALIDRGFPEQQADIVIENLIWYGVLGVTSEDQSVYYIYDVEYNSPVLKQRRFRRGSDDERFEINRAFWPALEVQATLVPANDQIPLL